MMNAVARLGINRCGLELATRNLDGVTILLEPEFEFFSVFALNFDNAVLYGAARTTVLFERCLLYTSPSPRDA